MQRIQAAMAVEVWYATPEGDRYAGMAGGPFPPRVPPGATWWIKQVRDIDLSPGSLVALAAWARTHAVPEIRLENGLSILRNADFCVFAELPTLERLTLGGLMPHLDQGLFEALGGLTALRALRLSRIRVDADGLRLLSRFPLRALSLSEVGDIAELARLEHLEHLEVQHGTIGAGTLPRMPRLRGLRWRELELDDAFWAMQPAAEFSELAVSSLGDPRRALPTVQRLELSTCPTVAALRHLPGLHQLRVPTLSPASHAGIASACPRLTSLAISGTLTPELTTALASIPGFTALAWDGQLEPSAPIPRIAVGMRTIPTLRLGDVSAALLKALGAAARVSSLSLASDDLKPDGYALIAQFPHLTALELRDALLLNDKAFATITAGGRLRSLSLERAGKLTDAGFLALGACSRMTAIRLSQCNGLSEKCLSVVQFLPELRTLDGFATTTAIITGCPAVDAHRMYLSVSELFAGDWLALMAMSAPPRVLLETVVGDPRQAAGAAPGHLWALALSGHVHGATLLQQNPGLVEVELDSPTADMAQALGRLPLLAKLRLKLPEPVTGLARVLAGLHGIRDLKIEGPGCDHELQAAVATLSNVVKCCLEGTAIAADAIAGLLARSPVRQLWFRRCEDLGDEVLAAIAGGRSLENVFLDQTTATGSGFAAWPADLPLTDLHINDGARLDPVHLGPLTALTALESINLSGCPKLTDRLWPILLANPTLRSVMVDQAPRMTRDAVDAVEQQMKAAHREFRIYHDLRKRVAAEQVHSRVVEKRWAKHQKQATRPGELAEAVITELRRLGATPGTSSAPADDGLPAPLSQLLDWIFPADVTFANDEDEDQHVWLASFRTSAENPMGGLGDELGCLQGRPFVQFGMADGGNYYIAIPSDPILSEDPPVYVIDHDWYSDDDAESMQPMTLSVFLKSLKPVKDEDE